MYKYGIISTASITKRFVDGLRLAGDEVVCIASRDINKAKQFAQENNIERYYDSYDCVYEDKDVDIVYIPVINTLHYDCAKKALLHNKHVVLEKPFTITSQEAKELFKISKAQNKLLFEGVKNLFVPSTEFIKNNLYRIGNVSHITTTQGASIVFPEGHWMYDIKNGGGAYFGSCSYVYHYLCYLFNDIPTNIDGIYIPSKNSDLICDFSFNLGNIKVNSNIDMTKKTDSTCVIYGDKGKMIIDEFWRSHHVLIETNDEQIKEFEDSGNEFQYEAKHVQECINKGLIESPIIKELDSVREMENIEYLYKKWKLI